MNATFYATHRFTPDVQAMSSTGKVMLGITLEISIILDAADARRLGEQLVAAADEAALITPDQST